MHFYRALLHLYPVSFRREYGAELCAVHGARLRQTGAGLPLAWFWIATVFDVTLNAAGAHWDVLVHDLRFTARTLRRSPGFTLTAVLVTALGIGANTAAFSVADFVLLRPLPFAEPERLVKLWEKPPLGGRFELSPPNYRDYVEQNRAFGSMGAFHGTSVNLVGRGDPQRLSGSTVSGDVLPMLGVKPLIGRAFTLDDEHSEAVGNVILSFGLWQRSFGGDQGVLGQRVLLDGDPRVVIGVMPREFNFPTAETALWTLMPRAERENDERDNNWFQVIARLKPGMQIAQANAEMNVIAASLASRFPKENKGIGASVISLRDELSSQSELMLLALCGAAICVLLIACANLANLLIARSLVRRRELDVRLALGAGRERLVRQLLTESLAIAAVGGALAYAAGRAMQSLLFGVEPGDGATFAAAAALCVLMTVAGSLLPVLRAVSVAPANVFRGE